MSRSFTPSIAFIGVFAACGSVGSSPDAALVDAPSVDTALEGDVDAIPVDAPLGAWGSAAPVLNVNTSAGSEFMPTLSGDGLELYFVRNTGGTDPGHLFVSTRTSTSSPWSTPSVLSIGVGHLHPELSVDALELYTQYSGDIYRATRGSRVAPWSTLTRLFAGNSPATVDAGTSLLYLSYVDGLPHVRHRGSPSQAWGAEESIATTTGIYNEIGVNGSETYLVVTTPVDPFSFPNAAALVRAPSELGWHDFLELPTLATAKAAGCDFVSDREIYCAVETMSRWDIVSFARM